MEYAFEQAVAMAGTDPFGFLFAERVGMLAVSVATPVIGFLLLRRMRAVAG